MESVLWLLFRVNLRDNIRDFRGLEADPARGRDGTLPPAQEQANAYKRGKMHIIWACQGLRGLSWRPESRQEKSPRVKGGCASPALGSNQVH